MYHHAVYIYTQGPEPIQLDPLVSPPLASSTAAAAPVCVVTGVRIVYLLLLSNRLDVCLFGTGDLSINSFIQL